MLQLAGPASTVEEHSIRKIFIRGDCGSIPAKEASFKTAKRTYVWRKLQQSDGFFQSRNLDLRKKLLR